MTEYVRRQEEQRIEELVETVRSDGESRVVLLSGDGGVGKTKLVRALAERHGADGETAWLPPIDVDDTKYWLISSLESFVCDELDPGRDRFISYYDAELNVYRFAGPYVGTETVLSHIGRMRREFVRCYRSLVERTGIVVVITLDTVETIRGMDLLRTMIEAIKQLPRTLLVLSGRPSLAGEQDDSSYWLDRASDPMRPVTIRLGGFTSVEAERFLEVSTARNLLNDDERSRLARLTGGSPLWLELAVEYLTTVDRPAILTRPESAELDRVLPPGAAPTKEGQRLREEFKRTVVSRYQTLDYWSEAVRRLAVLRHGIDARVWTSLTADLTWPPGIATPEAAWQALLDQPWVRPRSNNTLATLHDALAEELAQRVIPWHDHDCSWRRRLWAMAADSYAEHAGEPDELRDELEELTTLLLRAPIEPGRDVSVELTRARQLDAQIRTVDQLNTAWLHYQLLADPDAGTDLFLSMYEQAVKRHDIMFRELICHEIERFLPIRHAVRSSPDVLDMAVADFHRWLADGGRQKHIRIILEVARFRTDIEQPESAIALLTALPEPPSEPLLRYRQYNALGNASMRLRGRASEAEEHFMQALRNARELPGTERERCIAQAHKELGYYYRNMGNWNAADDQYRQARLALTDIPLPGAKSDYRSEMASIHTNWAYVKALQGNYQDARNLVDSAIDMRQRIGHVQGLGLSLSVSGEVYRYQGKYRRAWKAYAQAESTFEASHSWPLLGLLYQQQAICLHQASDEGMVVLSRKADQQDRAEDLITRAITICRDQVVRSYPSALNRAGRIFGSRDPARGLDYLEQAIDEASRMADGWFLSASLIEYIELNYRAWQASHEQRYRDAIAERIPQIEEAITNYQFNDLPGRWALLQGHLAIETALANQRYTGLDRALEHYMTGFVTLAMGHVGSHGKAAIGGEFATFQRLYEQLPPEVREDWYPKLLARWGELPADQSTSLLALLDKLY